MEKGEELDKHVDKLMEEYKNYKIPVSIGKKVKITKLSDDAFDGEHPNGIYEGYIKIGDELVPPTVGERYWIGNYWSTSPVVKIIDKNTIKTTYSTYKIEYLNENTAFK